MKTTFATTATLDLAYFDALDLAGLSIAEVAERLRHHGAAHLSAIERVELAERLTRRRFIIGAGALALGAITGCGPQGITTFAVSSAQMYPAPQAFLALFDSLEKALL